MDGILAHAMKKQQLQHNATLNANGTIWPISRKGAKGCRGPHQAKGDGGQIDKPERSMR